MSNLEKFYLEVPSINRKEEALEYLEEHVKYKSNINGVSGLDKILDGTYDYETWLEKIEKMKDKNYAYNINKVPGYAYFLVRENDNKLIGMISVRYALNEEMLKFSGHIGYGIRPTERRKGYNKINLYLGLQKAKEIGLDKVMLGCTIDNLGSDKTIKALGGVLERCELDSSDNKMTNVYWINVDESLEKYKDKYLKYIK